MLIDWFTVAAQGLNFIVLVWLLKRYLYKPVMDGIEVREKRIASTIADAESQRNAAEFERKAFAAKQSALDGQGAALLKEAARAADAEHARLLTDARADATALREKQTAALCEEQARLREVIAHRAQQEVLAIARKVLGDLAGSTLEERVVAVFLRHLNDLDAPTATDLSAAFGRASEAVVRSAFDLTEGQRALVRDTVTQKLSTAIRLRFDVAADLLCGVELCVGGQRLSWSIADYLDGLAQRIAPVSASAASPGPSMTAAAAAVPSP